MRSNQEEKLSFVVTFEGQPSSELCQPGSQGAFARKVRSIAELQKVGAEREMRRRRKLVESMVG